jgi:type IV secretory pathway VirB10-like protein
MASENLIDEQEQREEEYEQHPGGGRFNRLLGVTFVGVAMLGGVLLALGVQSSGTNQDAAAQRATDDPGAAARNRGEIEDLAAHGMEHDPAPSFVPTPAVIVSVQKTLERTAPKPPSRYAQWAQEKLMKALESPQMVPAFHGGEALEIPSSRNQAAGSFSSVDSSPAIASAETITIRRPATAYTVMAGSVIPGVLVTGINSDLPGPVIGQVSENVMDSGAGRFVLIPQGSRLIGAYQNASAFGQQRVQIAWQRLIFPNTSSMDLAQMPGADQSGHTGFSDQVDNHYLRTFGSAAAMSLISAGQMVGQMATFGGGGVYGQYGYYQPNQWAMAGETAGSGASGQFGGLGQQMLGNGMSRPPTIEIRPGYQFSVTVTQDLVFPGPYRN